jgi:uncharacterized protein YjiS (DUF1127 family)
VPVRGRLIQVKAGRCCPPYRTHTFVLESPIFDRIRTLIRHLHDVTEINALSDRDLSDLGISRDQLLDFLRMPQDISARVTAMAAIFGVPEDQLRRNYPQWVDLLTTCGHCADRSACAKVLDRGSEADPAEASFCGNRQVFAHLSAHPV